MWRNRLLLVLSLIGAIFAVGVMSSDYVTYHPGNLPLIITAPHGGYLKPKDIPDRKPKNNTALIGDMYTSDIAFAISDAVADKCHGARPHVVVFHVSRRKVDANRPIESGTDSPQGQAAWKEFHQAIQNAVDHVMANHEHGLILDIHGQAHPHERVELGYLLYKSELTRLDDDDQAMDEAVKRNSSIQALAKRVASLVPPHELLRGNGSFGDLLETSSNSVIRTMPSPSHPYPYSEERYYRGGYITQRYHTSNIMDAIQLELPKHLRFTKQGRDTITMAIADAACYMLDTYYTSQQRQQRWISAKL
ncbi:n-formylglutamate amidohydrolase [Lichtheimia corymbifera JMRC:FSU:9682]|uniref:N-formylglutamate amidohydrolase n=1 Tax=Lichtheimia corymbifera JMRC:FSU:9682 TaxID=1263082 RepID=A0A068SCD2_9FUNG|nr:n-formylglutamate amidohydrolase [Lichtheimia corymbifera JMRC:FSU:9682]